MSVGEGTTRYTVKSIMQRLYQLILTPPDDQGIQVSLGFDIDEVQNVISLGAFTITEDRMLLRQGSIFELGQELVRVVSYDQVLNAVTVTRGEYGTVPTPHVTPMLMNMNPAFTRASVFEAVGDNIIQLSPKLFTVGEELLSAVGGNVFPIGDPLAVEVLSIQPGDYSSTVDLEGRIVDFHPMTGSRSLITNGAIGQVWLRYRRRMGKATAESDLLVDLGVDERWVSAIMAGVAADLLVGRDVTAVQTEWVKSVLEAENIRPGSRMSIAGGLRQYRNMLVTGFEAEMKSEYRTRVTMRTVV